MSSKTFCDVCDKEIKEYHDGVSVRSHEIFNYCRKCWADKKSWPKIHAPEPKRE